MKPRPRPSPTPPPVDRAKVHALVAELHAAKRRGESIHATPPIYALDDLVGSCMVSAFVVYSLATDAPPPSVAHMVAHIMRHAPSWAADAARLRARG